MKVSWREGGLFIEPESDKDKDALKCLWEMNRQESSESGAEDGIVLAMPKTPLPKLEAHVLPTELDD